MHCTHTQRTIVSVRSTTNLSRTVGLQCRQAQAAACDYGSARYSAQSNLKQVIAVQSMITPSASPKPRELKPPSQAPT